MPCDNHGFIHDDDEFYWPDSCYLYEHAKARKKAYEEVRVDPTLIAHTSNPEYEKLGSDKHMEALRDRTIQVDVPFLMNWQKERRMLEEALNLECQGKGVEGFEHLHVDRDFSLLDQYGIKEEDLDKEKMLKLGKELTDFAEQFDKICDFEEEEPQYQGHPVGTPPPPPEKCTCDLMVLMATGCKCGYIEIERKKKADEN